jgi:hypothetical protein
LASRTVSQPCSLSSLLRNALGFLCDATRVERAVPERAAATVDDAIAGLALGTLGDTTPKV